MAEKSDAVPLTVRRIMLGRLGALALVLGIVSHGLVDLVGAGSAYDSPQEPVWVMAAAQALCWTSIVVGTLCSVAAAMLWLDATIPAAVKAVRRLDERRHQR